MEPGPGTPARTFEGLDEPPRDAPEGPKIPYVVHFDGDVGELEPGTPVRLKGFRVGRVTAVSLHYDPATRAFEAPVQIELEPRRIPFPASFQPSGGQWRPAVDDMLRTLIARGLRARLAQSPPLVGPREVTLAFVDHAPPASLQSEGGTQVIPAAASPDLSALEGRVGGILDKIDAIPIGQIFENLRVATGRLRDLSSSPKLDDTLTHVDQATASLDRAIQRAAPELPPLLTKLRTTADDLDETVAAARRTIGGDATSQDGDVPSLLRQLTEAARAMRALADEIDRQPEILLRGKPRERR
jgi:paraquat-inducible protein B